MNFHQSSSGEYLIMLQKPVWQTPRSLKIFYEMLTHSQGLVKKHSTNIISNYPTTLHITQRKYDLHYNELYESGMMVSYISTQCLTSRSVRFLQPLLASVSLRRNARMTGSFLRVSFILCHLRNIDINLITMSVFPLTVARCISF